MNLQPIRGSCLFSLPQVLYRATTVLEPIHAFHVGRTNAIYAAERGRRVFF
jgi:hypothetical protein